MSGRPAGGGPGGSGVAATDCPFEQQGYAAAYALDALDGEERRAFEAHLAAGCAICPAEIAAARGLAAQLPLALDDAADAPDAVSPSPGLRARILDAIAAENAAAGDDAGTAGTGGAPLTPVPAPAPVRDGGAPRLLRWRAPQAYATAAVLLLAIGLGLLGWNLVLQGQVREVRTERDRALLERNQAALERNQALLERDEARTTLATWQLASTTGQPASGQVLYLRQHQQAILVVENLPPLQPGQVYQVWLIRNGQPEGAGVLTVSSGETAMRADMSRYQVIALTIEPGPDGSPLPTTQPIMAGNITQ